MIHSEQQLMAQKACVATSMAFSVYDPLLFHT